MKKALIVWGGWDGHQPELVSVRLAAWMRENGFEVEVSQTLDSFLDAGKLQKLDLIVPLWTMGEITGEQCTGVMKAVEAGVGMAGSHGGMCDAFRNSVDWQFMTGAQWVAHPGGLVDYTVNIRRGSSSPIIQGIDDFQLNSEQYYIHIDPAVQILATTRFPTFDGPHAANGFVDVPVAYTKMWGKGRVFYTSLGHQDDVFEIPEAMQIMTRGILWAAKAL